MSQPSTARPFTKLVHKKAYEAISSSKPALSQQGKTLLITGGSQGIGYAICEAFAAAGASNIIIVAQNLERLISAKETLEHEHPSTKVHVFSTSIDDVMKVKSIFEKIRADIIEPDILILNAGRCHKPAPVLSTSVDDQWADFEINVKANLGFVAEYLKPDTLSKPKTILNVSTTVAHIRYPTIAAYGASKEAFMAMLDAVQAEYKDKGVKIVNFHPGAVFTSMARNNGFDENDFDYDQADLAGQFALWLASAEADFLKGKFVYAGWDVDELKARAKQIESSELLKIGLIGEPAA
ncbi:hypothetical protein P7C71_g3693, partial [Lecanoromycetidae sp. Uapishka_2]